MIPFSDLLKRNIEDETLYYAVLSSPKTNCHAQKITVRPIITRQGLIYQLSEQRGAQIFHRNVEKDDLADLLLNELNKQFHQAIYHTKDADYHLLVSRKGKETLLRKKPTRKAEIPIHNRKKKYLLEEGTPSPFLVELGIMNASGRVFPKKMDKFRQINRFLEIASDTFDELPSDHPLNIIDFGCGKSYLTFALYEYIRESQKHPPNIIGLDLKSDVIAKCNSLAKELNYPTLHFDVGDIEGYVPKIAVDMVICLHACDTSTDAALENAVNWGAKVVLAVPCCQKEVYSQVDQPVLTTLLRHGILRERFAALATDAARADVLETKGYRCQIMEFIDSEHTPKNLLIRAVKCGTPESIDAAKLRLGQFLKHLNISPSLQKRLN